MALISECWKILANRKDTTHPLYTQAIYLLCSKKHVCEKWIVEAQCDISAMTRSHNRAHAFVKPNYKWMGVRKKNRGSQRKPTKTWIFIMDLLLKVLIQKIFATKYYCLVLSNVGLGHSDIYHEVGWLYFRILWFPKAQ